MSVAPAIETDPERGESKCLARSVTNILAQEPALEAVTVDRARKTISVATLGRADVPKITERVAAQLDAIRSLPARGSVPYAGRSAAPTLADMSASEFTHLDPLGRARMVDVTAKEATHRRAVARLSLGIAQHLGTLCRTGRGFGDRRPSVRARIVSWHRLCRDGLRGAGAGHGDPDEAAKTAGPAGIAATTGGSNAARAPRMVFSATRELGKPS